MKKNHKLLAAIIIFGSIFIIVFPLLLDQYVFGNSFSTNLDNEEWSGFLGSYVGSIIGALATILAVLYSFHLSNRNQIQSEIWENSLIVYYDLFFGIADLKKLYINIHNTKYTNYPVKMFFSNEWIKNVAKISGDEKDTEKIFLLYGDLESISNGIDTKNKLLSKNEEEPFSLKNMENLIDVVSKKVFSTAFLESDMKVYSNESDVSLDINKDLNDDYKILICNLKQMKEKYKK